MTHILKNNTVDDVTLDIGRVVPGSGQYQIDSANLYAFYSSTDVLTKLSNGDFTLNDGTVDLSLTEAIDHLRGYYQKYPIDPDTGTPSVSTRKLPSSWYPEFREIEFTTSTKDSIHDKDENDVDLGEHNIKFYDGETDITSDTQANILLNCDRTVVQFAPGRNWSIRGAYTRQIQIPVTPVYVWTTFIIEAAPGYYVRNPYANGGLNMEFQNVRESVGDEGENYSFFNANDKIEWVLRHDVGLQHRIRVIYQLGFEVGS